MFQKLESVPKLLRSYGLIFRPSGAQAGLSSPKCFRKRPTSLNPNPPLLRLFRAFRRRAANLTMVAHSRLQAYYFGRVSLSTTHITVKMTAQMAIATMSRKRIPVTDDPCCALSVGPPSPESIPCSTHLAPSPSITSQHIDSLYQVYQFRRDCPENFVFPTMTLRCMMPSVTRRLSGEPKRRRCRQLPGAI